MSEPVENLTLLNSHIEEAAAVILTTKKLIPQVLEVSSVLTLALKNGNKIMWCGNGGSAADSQHLAAELVGKYKINRSGIASMALTTDTSILTSLANDFSADIVFSRQVEAIGKRGDILVCLTTSGRSPNILLAISKAKEMEISTVLFSSTQAINVNVDLALLVESDKTEHIQHAHIVLGHVICEIIESNIYG